MSRLHTFWEGGIMSRHWIKAHPTSLSQTHTLQTQITEKFDKEMGWGLGSGSVGKLKLAFDSGKPHEAGCSRVYLYSQWHSPPTAEGEPAHLPHTLANSRRLCLNSVGTENWPEFFSDLHTYTVV